MCAFVAQNVDYEKGLPCTKNTRDCPTRRNPLHPAATAPPSAARAEVAIPATMER